MFFRALTPTDEKKFRKWIRDNDHPGDPIDGAWHPVAQDEARRLNEERAIFVMDASDAGEAFP